MSVENNDSNKKKKWNTEDWLFHILLAFPIAIIPIASIVLIMLLPE